MEFQLTSKG